MLTLYSTATGRAFMSYRGVFFSAYSAAGGLFAAVSCVTELEALPALRRGPSPRLFSTSPDTVDI